MTRVVVATGNQGKLAELQRLWDDVPDLELCTMASLGLTAGVDEDGNTFRDNALKKACAAAIATGLPAVADDSGLEVDFLGGLPGIRSARYAGDDASDSQNNEKLLRALEGVPLAQRTARFRCAIVLVDPKGRELASADGVCEGRIAEAPAGAHGFGYDPIFIPLGFDCSAAQMPPSQKNEISHRAAAARAIRGALARAITTKS